MDFEPLQQTISALIEPLLREECVELIGMKIVQTNRGISVSLFVDKQAGGITLDICAGLNRRIGDLLESTDVIEGGYFLEVSSPGLDRNLKTPKDFLRCLGSEVRFFLNAQVNGKLEWAGCVRDAGEQSVRIEIKGTLLEIPYENINKAQLIL